MCLFAEILKNNGVSFAGCGAEGAAQAKAACVCGGNTQISYRVRTHARLNDGILNADKLGKSCFYHGFCSFQ